MSNFYQILQQRRAKTNSLLCVGLDTDPDRIPQILANDPDPMFSFNREIIDATHDLVACYKPQIAYYSAVGAEDTLIATIEYAQKLGVPVLLDAKRGDIGSTAEMYAKELFGRFRADAVTVNPYMGLDAMQPFLDYVDKGIYILCRTSNPGGSDLQNLILEGGKMVYEHVAEKAAGDWNGHNNVALVVGATRPEEIGRIRSIVGEMEFLLPGVGSQGADIEALMKNGQGGGLTINSSRSVVYASEQSDFAVAARRVAEATRMEINRYR
ncbi:MAG: orotidine-5'-phosphate decarboxylase [Candidatus Azotimanducaceae bacterium]